MSLDLDKKYVCVTLSENFLKKQIPFLIILIKYIFPITLKGGGGLSCYNCWYENTVHKLHGH